MCGIFGVIDHAHDDAPDPGRLRDTARLLQHRGPDGSGIVSEPGIGLVHTRLSLLDLSERSNQPFWDATGRYCLVYNGEVYNFQELRTELQREGAVFRTTGDTEVVLEALLHWGPDRALRRLEGMFALALHDREDGSVCLARDRFGIKPMFVHRDGDRVVFASEIQALRPWVRFEPDLLSVSSFLQRFSGPTRSFTFLKGVRFLDPGCWLLVERSGACSEHRFAALHDFIDPGETERFERMRPAAIVDEFEARLDASVKAQLVADAPVGALCSGGIDSSIILALAARHHSNLAIFHANVVGPLSEHDAARRLARHLKLDLLAVEVRDADFVRLIPEVMQHYGYPFYACPHSVPFLMVSRLVRWSGVKAVLSGEGADECFLGYDYLTPRLRDLIGLRALRGRMRALRGRRERPNAFRYRGLTYAGGTDIARHPELVVSLHNRFEVIEEALEARERAEQSGLHGDAARGSLESIDLLHYNLRSILHRNDTMGMAASIESRFPYLDSSLVKASINLPRQYKIRFSPAVSDGARALFCDKWVLREIGRRHLPRELYRRAKRPFPVNAYSSARLTIDGTFVERSPLRDVFGLSKRGAAVLGQAAGSDLKWKLLQLDVWARLFIGHETVDGVADALRACMSVAA